MEMKTKKMIFAALFTALTCVATMVIKLPTPTMGYIHPGDAVVLLSGLILGPVYGGLAAAIGSMFADLLSGYMVYAPATFIIKLLTAVIAANFVKVFPGKKHTITAVILSGTLGEAFMVIGYFVFEICIVVFTTADGFGVTGLTAGIVSSASGIPFNIVQGFFGVILAAVLYPILMKVYNRMQGE